jgi:hypothetical protein
LNLADELNAILRDRGLPYRPILESSVSTEERSPILKPATGGIREILIESRFDVLIVLTPLHDAPSHDGPAYQEVVPAVVVALAIIGVNRLFHNPIRVRDRRRG